VKLVLRHGIVLRGRVLPTVDEEADAVVIMNDMEHRTFILACEEFIYGIPYESVWYWRDEDDDPEQAAEQEIN
jgi:hypothetical protein